MAIDGLRFADIDGDGVSTADSILKPETDNGPRSLTTISGLILFQVLQPYSKSKGHMDDTAFSITYLSTLARTKVLIRTTYLDGNGVL